MAEAVPGAPSTPGVTSTSPSNSEIEAGANTTELRKAVRSNSTE